MDGHELRRTLATHKKITRVYRDDRFPPAPGSPCDLRAFAVTTMWVIGVERPAQGEIWTRVCSILHLDRYHFWRVIAADAPRWEPPGYWAQYERGCEAPMIRRGGTCGKYGTSRPRVTDPVDGTWRLASFCSRHREHAQQVAAAERARVRTGGIPEPVPNTGGLLPCYIGWTWPDQYAIARPGWKPPAAGVCADDWPIPAKVTAQQPPGLRLMPAAADADDDAPVPRGEGAAAPVLTLVRP